MGEQRIMNDQDLSAKKNLSPNVLSPWREVLFFSQSHEFFTSAIDSVRRAEHSVDLEVYILTWDALTEILLSELGQAVTRGVAVRVILDGIGSLNDQDVLEQEFLKRKIPFLIYQPVPKLRELFHKENWNFKAPVSFVLGRYNRRDHKKTLLVDNQFLFIGSQNWTHVHSEFLNKEKAWKDFAVKLEVRRLAVLRLARLHFDWIWQKKKFRRWDRFYRLPGSVFRIYNARRSRVMNYREVAMKIHKATHRIYIVSPYFLPKRRILRSLTKAVRRGLDVQILIPGLSDVPIVKLASLGMLHNLCKRGVQVLEYQGRILHSKYLLIDDWAKLGSFNFNHRSLLHDLEIEVVFSADDEPAAIERIHEEWVNDRMRTKPWHLPARGLERFLLLMLSSLAFRLRYFL